MKQCKCCWKLKDDSEFSPGQANCKPCRSELRRFDYAKKIGTREPIPREIAPSVNYAKKLFRSYDGHELEFPVKAWWHTRPVPNGCVLRNDGKHDWFYVYSFRGERTVLFDVVGPNDLILLLREMGLELILPKDNVELQR